MTRSLRLPTLFLAGALVATACSGGGGGSPAASAPAASEPASSGASGGPVTSGAAGTLNVLSLWGGSEEEAFLPLAPSEVILDQNPVREATILRVFAELLDRGARFVISSDGHSQAALGRLRWGVLVARRAWLEPSHVLNTRPFAEFRASLRRARR